jgi:predicted ArsR family transcriptional regulator
MHPTHGNKRFWGSTRGRIVALLRRTSRTVDELAQTLDLTDNAVRAQIATLERDGLVEQRGVRRGASKPAFAYDLTPEAEQLFPKAYEPALAQLLAVLTERFGSAAVEDLLRSVGHRIAGGHTAADLPLEARLAAAVALLNGLGGLAEYEVTERGVAIQGYRCPLAAIATDHPTICLLAEALVSDAAGIPMTERCERGARPRCRFEGVFAAESRD